jgi:ATP:ADP antiporter, AAA family
VLWAPALARVLDQSLRYTLDKTSREILFLPLPDAIKLKAKPFVDVTVDRAARAGAALLLIVLVQPWGLNLDWQRISYASLTMVALWIVMSLRARRGYLRAFRQSIERQDLAPADVRLSGADLTTVETLVQELAHVDARRVVYAIDLLESLGKRNLVTPLLLHHDIAGGARARAPCDGRGTQRDDRRVAPADPPAPGRRGAAGPGSRDSGDWGHQQRGRGDAGARDDGGTQPAAPCHGCHRAGQQRQRRMTSRWPRPPCSTSASDSSEQGRAARLEVAAVVREIDDPRFRGCSCRCSPTRRPTSPTRPAERGGDGAADFLFVPALVALLRHRQLKGRARDVLVTFGEPVIDPLTYFLNDRDEDIWVRRHIPGTLARITSPRSVDVLVTALSDPDGFLRFKAIAGLERLRHADASLSMPRVPIEAQAVREATATTPISPCTTTCSGGAAWPAIRSWRRPSTRRWTGAGHASISSCRCSTRGRTSPPRTGRSNAETRVGAPAPRSISTTC